MVRGIKGGLYDTLSEGVRLREDGRNERNSV